ncbi:glycosidase [Sphingomonas sp. 37zxx]|uniref:glycoside hydrolase family 130 protein n=1 Tax=Sphingomonas sp. 37zxx TaxID=1550073 RepID=UPI00053BF801|nr:glycosidase [Sphingomonas sp. 37zxx]
MTDHLIFTPDDVDLTRSPLRRSLDEPTFVLGAFNPGFTRLANGNLLLMVRVAEALVQPVVDGHARTIRWTAKGYVLDRFAVDEIDMADPRQFELKGRRNRLLGLTSLSWLLPVEIDPQGERVVAVHYDRAIEPQANWQDYGIEDARISRIGARWYMTVCAVSAERHSTALYTSDNALDWRCEGMVLDHQNKDMLLFEGLVGGRFMALTRPLGECYFAYPGTSEWAGGPSINFAQSPDALHWKPIEAPGIRARAGSTSALKVGGGTPPVLTDAGWLTLYHGVEQQASVGVYRTFWALFDRDDPTRILAVEDRVPLIEANAALTAHLAHQMYLPSPVVFSTGMVDGGDDWIVASGEADLACRMTRVAKGVFG